MARLLTLQIIETDDIRGKGVEGDPSYRVKQYFSTDGILLLEVDPIKETTIGMWNLAEYLKNK